MLTHPKPFHKRYTQTKAVWDKKHRAMQAKWRFEMLTHPKPFHKRYTQTEAVWDKKHRAMQAK